MNPPALRRRARLVAAALALAVAVVPPAQSQGLGSRTPVTLNFVNADIEAVTRAIATMIDRQIAVDPRVKGTITVYSEQPQTVAEAYQGYLAALRGLGFAMVESGGLLKVVPEADAKLQTSTVVVGEPTRRGDQIVTQIFTLRHENPNNLVAVLRPLISANNTINASPSTNSLVITDYAENLQRIAKIIAALDHPSSTEVEIIPLQHVVASDIAPVVQRMADGGVAAVPGVIAAGATTVLADARTNSLLVRSPNAARLAIVKAAIAKLDRPSAGGGIPGAPGYWVVHLKNADAAKLATVLRAAFAGGAGGSSGGATGPGGLPTIPTQPTQPPGSLLGGAPPGAATSPQATAPLAASAQPSTGGFIQADPATNSLIITAPEALYRQVRAMIDQLDTRRAQVYIESMIVEVTGDDAADIGFQWLGMLSNDSVGALQNLAVGRQPEILSTTNNLAALGQGLSIGLLRTVGSVTSLTAVLRLLQSRTSTNLVATPNLITLDNEEAKIVVGDNVPFITGQFTSTGTSTTNPFQTIERKDVGITLRIKPQIGESGAIRLQIYQEQSAVRESTAPGTSNAGPTTSKRSIEGTVTVDDGQILVLGGLVQDRFENSRSKVPLLGDLPFLGTLFRSETRSRTRTNLMVFLRPIVLRDGEGAAAFSHDRYEQIRARQQGAQPAPSVVMPINEVPQLPPNRPGMPAPTLPIEDPSRRPPSPPPAPPPPAAGAEPVIPPPPRTP